MTAQQLAMVNRMPGRASDTTIEMVATPAALSLEELSRALAHEAGAVGRLWLAESKQR